MSLAQHVTREQVLEMRSRSAAGESQSAIARTMGLDRSTVSKWPRHDDLPAMTKADMAGRAGRAVAMRRADPTMGLRAIGRAVRAHETTVRTWLAEAGLLSEAPRRLAVRPRPQQEDPFIDLLHVEFHDVDVSDEWRRFGLRRWAYVPRRPATAVPSASEWVA